MALGSLIGKVIRLFAKVPKASGSIYDFSARTIDGRDIDFNQYRGKKLLIVNTASKCGYTYQYSGLQKLHEQFHPSIEILGFPANDFLWQEPGSASEIAEFCSRNYGVDFQMFDKISVKGSTMHPLFQWLSGKTGEVPSWNFCKYLVDEKGSSVMFFNSKVEPLDKTLTDHLK